MENRLIPDKKISASSEDEYFSARQGRLKNPLLAWCTTVEDPGEYLQIDLQTPHILCALSTQGWSVYDFQKFVKEYTLQSSIDGITWTNYGENGQVKVKYKLLYLSMTFTANVKMKISFS